MTHPVTDHAVVRYFERIHGLTHLSARYHRDPDRAAAGAALLGLTLDEARDLVCPPRLHKALRLGDGIVKGDDRVLRVVDGRIVTCFAPAVRTRKAMPRETRVV